MSGSQLGRRRQPARKLDAQPLPLIPLSIAQVLEIDPKIIPTRARAKWALDVSNETALAPRRRHLLRLAGGAWRWRLGHLIRRMGANAGDLSPPQPLLTPLPRDRFVVALACFLVLQDQEKEAACAYHSKRFQA